MKISKIFYSLLFISFLFGYMFSQECNKKIKPWFKITPLHKILKNNPDIKIVKCFEKIPYNFELFPPSNLYPHQGYCPDSFIALIPNGKAQGLRGDVFIENCFIQEMLYGGLWQLLINLPKIPQEKIKKIHGRVAIISQDLTNYYFHWIQDVLQRLALLEIFNIQYDYLYVPTHKKYMKETLELWGVDPQKIISPNSPIFGIHADELIVPSLAINKNQGTMKYAGFHYNPITMKYVSEKLINAAKKKSIDTSHFSQKIFISRKDAPDRRRILNEDAIFSLLEGKGFVHYELSKLSVAEQIILFNQAKMVIGEHGAGLTNCLFCQPNTQIIEIFQYLIDSSFWWISQVMNLNYLSIQTTSINADYFAHYGTDPRKYRKAWEMQPTIPIKKIKKLAKRL